MPDQVDWGKQDKHSEMVRIFVPGHWNEGHRTVLSKKYREQKAKTRQVRNAPLVPALAEEEIEKREELRHMTRAQVREASALWWGLELIIAVPSEVRRLATEVDWKSIDGVWDPWAGNGAISEVMMEQWSHLRFMNNDWNSQLGWPEARDALQPGNYRIWKEKYGVCGAVITSPWCMWVLVFKSPLVRARMLQGGEDDGIGMFTFSLGRFVADGDTTQYAEQARI
ncbi:hypothetical protein CYMTET_15582 [Cymbomonas tetramitiformis]|uniref:Methyltransferase n=1 Tax=Cymbomonas tetramitiformis TaxID=36881 RepID=A0AAE0L952_9CHLO|nr:hypothetical protein CYMTET_15582 [Cymbomonas tetramitiformis]